MQPSGFVLSTSDFTTNTFAANRTLQVDPALLHPTTLNYSTSQALRGGLKVTVAVTSSDTNVGTIVGSATFIGGGDTFNLTDGVRSGDDRRDHDQPHDTGGLHHAEQPPVDPGARRRAEHHHRQPDRRARSAGSPRRSSWPPRRRVP